MILNNKKRRNKSISFLYPSPANMTCSSAANPKTPMLEILLISRGKILSWFLSKMVVLAEKFLAIFIWSSLVTLL